MIDVISTACSDQEPFALMVLGDEMLPEFSHGMVITIDPSHPILSGVFVVVCIGSATHFGRYHLINDEAFLSFLNSDATILLEGDYVIKGAVIQSYKRRISTYYQYPKIDKFITYQSSRYKKHQKLHTKI